MAKRTVDFSDYQEPTYEEYTGEDPPANAWFTGKVVRGNYLEEDDQVRFIVEIVDHPDFAGWGRGWYAPFEGNMKWKMQEIVRAIQGGKQTPVTIDWENDTAIANWLKKAKPIKFQTEKYNDAIKIKKVRPLLDVAGGKAAGPKPAPEPELSSSEDDPEPYTREELEDMSAGLLLDILQEEFEVPDDEVPTKGRRMKEETYLDLLVDAVLAEQETVNDPEAADGDDDEFDDGFEQDPEPEPEPEPEPAPRARRAAKKAAPAKAAAEPAPTTRTRRSRR
jgi:hypothetical protein